MFPWYVYNLFDNTGPNFLQTQLIKTENGIKVITDHGEELLADAVLFATGNYLHFLITSSISIALIRIFHEVVKNVYFMKRSMQLV